MLAGRVEVVGRGKRGCRDADAGAPEVLAAVRCLAPEQRAVVVLFSFEDRPMAEIADILGCSESTGWDR